MTDSPDGLQVADLVGNYLGEHKNSMNNRTTGHWMATSKAWGLASSLWEALLAWGAGGGPVEAPASTASTATY